MLKTIRARSIIVVAVAVLLSTAIAPPPRVKACPSSDIWTEYYDCALNQVGEKFRGCDCSGFDWGQLSGYFKDQVMLQPGPSHHPGTSCPVHPPPSADC
jgi:hypothetical protein